MTASAVQAPRHLSTASKRLWKALMDDFVLDDSGALIALQSLCEAYDRVQQAREILKKDGPITRDRWGVPRAHPATVIESSARAQMHSALRLLRLSPDDLQGRVE
jgi:P27 family predicted phage terminase small subunit